MMENGADMFGLLDEKGVYLNCGGSITKVLGYSPEELIGQNAINFIHPEDLPIALEALSQLLETGYTVITEFRFKSADNDWVWLETIGRNHLQTPAIQALVLNSRDVTERVRNREQLQHS
ncbi:MAG: PAS domain-containing protein, partial [Rufibacter sp.]